MYYLCRQTVPVVPLSTVQRACSSQWAWNISSATIKCHRISTGSASRPGTRAHTSLGSRAREWVSIAMFFDYAAKFWTKILDLVVFISLKYTLIGSYVLKKKCDSNTFKSNFTENGVIYRKIFEIANMLKKRNYSLIKILITRRKLLYFLWLASSATLAIFSPHIIELESTLATQIRTWNSLAIFRVRTFWWSGRTRATRWSTSCGRGTACTSARTWRPSSWSSPTRTRTCSARSSIGRCWTWRRSWAGQCPGPTATSISSSSRATSPWSSKCDRSTTIPTSRSAAVGSAICDLRDMREMSDFVLRVQEGRDRDWCFRSVNCRTCSGYSNKMSCVIVNLCFLAHSSRCEWNFYTSDRFLYPFRTVFEKKWWKLCLNTSRIK